jgi:hypothetical protein
MWKTSLSTKSIHIKSFRTPTIHKQIHKMSGNAQTPHPSSNEPSMIGGHAQYAKGYVESTIGNVTGSADWKQSGEKDMQGGIGEMKVRNLAACNYRSVGY